MLIYIVDSLFNQAHVFALSKHSKSIFSHLLVRGKVSLVRQIGSTSGAAIAHTHSCNGPESRTILTAISCSRVPVHLFFPQSITDALQRYEMSRVMSACARADSHCQVESVLGSAREKCQPASFINAFLGHGNGNFAFAKSGVEKCKLNCHTRHR